jgi:hypothetical protein
VLAKRLRQGSVVIGGSLAQNPGYGGLTWVFLQLLLGFKRLGWNVLFLDRLEPEMCVDASGAQCSFESSLNVRYLSQVMAQYGLSDDFAVAGERYRDFTGLARSQVLERVRAADFFLNVMGFFADPEITATARRRVFYDIDPGFTQMWQDLGLADLLKGQDDFVTVGENIGRRECAIPTCGQDWIATRHPVVLDQWPVSSGTNNGRFTDIGAWRGPNGPVEYGGKTYGLRVHEFRKFVPLPRITGESFEIACDIHPAEVKDLALLAENNWRVIEPKTVAADPAGYRHYLSSSRAQFMVAKGMYVQSHCGLISDRCACYLASGKPVLAQDTGFSRHYPTGTGLISFSSLEEARDGVAEITRDYGKHSRAARAIAQEYFDSDKVLGDLVAKLA